MLYVHFPQAPFPLLGYIVTRPSLLLGQIPNRPDRKQKIRNGVYIYIYKKVLTFLVWYLDLYFRIKKSPTILGEDKFKCDQLYHKDKVDIISSFLLLEVEQSQLKNFYVIQIALFHGTPQLVKCIFKQPCFTILSNW